MKIFEIDFLQSRDKESVISFDFPIFIIPFMIPSMTLTFPFLYYKDVNDHIEER